MERRKEAVLQENVREVTCLAVTSDNKYIISDFRNKYIIIWSFSEKRQETVLKGHDDLINCLIATSDNKYIVSGSKDKTIRI